MQLANIPSKIQTPFAATGSKVTIPVPSQIAVTPGRASFTDGFPPLTRTAKVAGGIPPFGTDMNGILYAITIVQQWQSAGGGFKYDAAFSAAVGGYPKGSTLLNAAGDGYWISSADDNTTDPDSVGAANWVSLDSYGIGLVSGLTNSNVTLTPAQYNKPVVVFTGALTGNVVLTFPTNQGPVRVVNNTTGAFTVTCKTAGGIPYTVVQGGHELFYGDGTNLVPNLGNTPPKFDNSKRPVTSEFVKRAGLQHGVPVSYSASATLSAVTGVGSLVIINANVEPITLTLPPAASCDQGSVITFANTSFYDCTVNAAAGEFINPGNTGVSSVVVKAGESLCISLTGTIWVFFAGSTQVTSKFLASLTVAGYQKLPSGLIKQWGRDVSVGTALGVQIFYTIAFPNAALTTIGLARTNVCPGVAMIPIDNTSFQLYARDYVGTYLTTLIQWEAIGY